MPFTLRCHARAGGAVVGGGQAEDPRARAQAGSEERQGQGARRVSEAPQARPEGRQAPARGRRRPPPLGPGRRGGRHLPARRRAVHGRGLRCPRRGRVQADPEPRSRSARRVRAARRALRADGAHRRGARRAADRRGRLSPPGQEERSARPAAQDGERRPLEHEEPDQGRGPAAPGGQDRRRDRGVSARGRGARAAGRRRGGGRRLPPHPRARRAQRARAVDARAEPRRARQGRRGDPARRARAPARRRQHRALRAARRAIRAREEARRSRSACCAGSPSCYRSRGDEGRAREILQRFADVVELARRRRRGRVRAGRRRAQAAAGLLDDDADALFGDEFPDTEGAPELSIDFGSELEIGPGASLSGAPRHRRRSPRRTRIVAARRRGAAARGRARDRSPRSPPDSEQLLAEASVYLRYGKRDKAIAHLRARDRGESESPRRAREARRGATPRAASTRRRWRSGCARRCARTRSATADALRVLRGRIAVLDESAAAQHSRGRARARRGDRIAPGTRRPARRAGARRTTSCSTTTSCSRAICRSTTAATPRRETQVDEPERPRSELESDESGLDARLGRARGRTVDGSDEPIGRPEVDSTPTSRRQPARAPLARPLEAAGARRPRGSRLLHAAGAARRSRGDLSARARGRAESPARARATRARSPRRAAKARARRAPPEIRFRLARRRVLTRARRRAGANPTRSRSRSTSPTTRSAATPEPVSAGAELDDLASLDLDDDEPAAEAESDEGVVDGSDTEEFLRPSVEPRAPERVRPVAAGGDDDGGGSLPPGPISPHLVPIIARDVHKRPADSLRSHSASLAVSPRPARPSVGRREVGGKSRLPSGQSFTPTSSPRSLATLRVASCLRCEAAPPGQGPPVWSAPVDFLPGQISVSAGIRAEHALRAAPAAASCGPRASAPAGRGHLPRTPQRRP